MEELLLNFYEEMITAHFNGAGDKAKIKNMQIEIVEKYKLKIKSFLS